jgi:translation initiation factor 2B subunit (eIF-2B alpha/beta/delta family)
MDDNLIDQINSIKTDDVHGASWLAQQAIKVLTLAASQSKGATITAFIKEIKEVAGELACARPNLTPIANYSNQFLHLIMMESKHANEPAAVKRFAELKGKELEKSATRAFSKTTEYASGIISDLDTILTCSYSSTVCRVIELASQRQTRFRVIVAESNFSGKAYGEMTAHELMKHQIPVEVLPDRNISIRVSKADKALVGADSITGDGYLINGKPTLLLAYAAKSKDVPFYVACESAKFAIRGYVTNSMEPEAAFDRVPLDLVTGIITEKGTMLPNVVTSYIEEKTEEMSHLAVLKGD